MSTAKRQKEEHMAKHESLLEQSDVEDLAELIDQSHYRNDENDSGEAMVYEGDPQNRGVSRLFFLNILLHC